MKQTEFEIDADGEILLAEWTSGYINALPDSAFLYIAPGGEKEAGKTKPRTLRYFPFRDEKGAIDLPHLRNAIAQAPKAKLPAAIIAKVQAKGRKVLEAESKEAAEKDPKEKGVGEVRKVGPWQSAEKDEPFGGKQAPPFKKKTAAADGLWSAPVALAEGGAKWVEIARSGSHFGRASDRKVTLSAEDIESMARGYETIQAENWFATGAPVTYNHATVMGAKDPESTKAAGRILDLKTKANEAGGLSLMGLIQWTSEARARVRAGEFDGFSIEALPPASARSKSNGKPLGEWALVGGTLTNEPMISGMAPVAAAETRSEPKMDAITILRGTLALSADATAAEVIAKAQGLTESAAKAEALSEMLDTVKADRDALQKERDDLGAWKREKMLDLACDEGRIAASERDRYARWVDAMGEAEANEVFYVNRLNVMGEVGSSAPVDTGTAQGFAAIAGEVDAYADTLVAGEGLEIAAAYGRAMAEVLADPAKRAAYEAETSNKTN